MTGPQLAANNVGEENYLRAWEILFVGPTNGGGLGAKARGGGPSD